MLAAASVAAGNVAFTLSPALASSTLLDYRTGEGIKIYGKATSPLDVAFDGDSGALRLFLNKVQQRATQFGWTDILQVAQAGQVFYFIENYGRESLSTQSRHRRCHLSRQMTGTHKISCRCIRS
jgi:hypothetical protein